MRSILYPGTLLGLLAAASLLSGLPETVTAQSAEIDAAPSLKDVFKGKFLIGAALNESQFTERDSVAAALVKRQFNTISPENVMKWAVIQPGPDRYNFGPADRYVEFGEKNGMFIVGHNLVWHQQTPGWVFESSKGKPASRSVLLQRMHDHIQTVVGRYKGRVKGWDVVNEALAEDGRLRQTPWLKIIGKDYLAKAFEFAHEADPGAELYYNDYSLENAPKRRGAISLVKKLRAAGIPVTAVGIQAHVSMDWPTLQQEDDAISEIGKLGVKVMITELDVNVLPRVNSDGSTEVSLHAAEDPALNPYRDGLPDSVQKALAQRYADLFTVFLKHSAVVQRVTFWGVTDGDSWLNNWPVRGRTSYPLLFDRAGNPKPAFLRVVETAAAKTAAWN